jgi:hypothetical protein
MPATATKTVRFTKVVERAGEPHAHTLWLPPDKDPELKRALAGNRVMTIEPGAGSGKTDVGHVGFDPKRSPLGQLLIFPKSLQRFAGARVVGIKFDLIEQPKLAPATELKRVTERKSARRKKSKSPAKAVGTVPVIPFATEQPQAPAPKPVARSASREPSSDHDSALTREVRAALKDLEAGRAVAAYNRLQAAIEKGSSER